jgi:Spy/CpxP family protein refolding chaperone
MKRIDAVVLGAVLLVVVSTGGLAYARQDPAAGPGGQGQRGARAGGPVVTPQELERWFDSYVLLQAQESLKLSDAQFPRFLVRLKALQDLRRRNLQERRQLLLALGKLLKESPVDEPQTKEKLKALIDLETRGSDEVRRARESLDEVLDPIQQARLRLLEDAVERKKVDLLVRARQAAGAGPRLAPGPNR